MLNAVQIKGLLKTLFPKPTLTKILYGKHIPPLPGGDDNLRKSKGKKAATLQVPLLSIILSG
jgi:hypothetical protein